MRRRDPFSRTGFSLFDFWRRPGWRLGVDDGPRNRDWYITSTVSLLLGFWFVWEDIVGGASLIRIVTIWIVVSGVVFYFLIRLRRTALWGAGIAAVTAVMIMGFEVNQWMDQDQWPGWTVGHMLEFVGFQPKPDTYFSNQLLDFSLIGGLVGTSILFLVIWIAAVKLGKFKAEGGRPATGDADDGDMNDDGQKNRE